MVLTEDDMAAVDRQQRGSMSAMQKGMRYAQECSLVYVQGAQVVNRNVAADGVKSGEARKKTGAKLADARAAIGLTSTGNKFLDRHERHGGTKPGIAMRYGGRAGTRSLVSAEGDGGTQYRQSCISAGLFAVDSRGRIDYSIEAQLNNTLITLSMKELDMNGSWKSSPKLDQAQGWTYVRPIGRSSADCGGPP